MDSNSADDIDSIALQEVRGDRDADDDDDDDGEED
jgi:hypothetical protein